VNALAGRSARMSRAAVPGSTCWRRTGWSKSAKETSLSARFLSALRYPTCWRPSSTRRFTSTISPISSRRCQGPGSFAGHARLYQLFDYRVPGFPTQNYAQARAWMRHHSTPRATRLAPACACHDCGAYRRMLDGRRQQREFVLQLCAAIRAARHRARSALVCEIGMEHVLAEPSARASAS